MSKEEIFKIIVGHMVEVLPEINAEDVLMSHSLADWGANSIDRSEIVMLTMESLSLRIPLIEFGKAKNIGDMVDIIHANS